MESNKKSFKIGNDQYEEVVEGLPQPGDQLVDGVLYRKVENKTPAETGSKAVTKAPAKAVEEVPAPVTTHWYDGITPKKVLQWLGILGLVALLILGIIYAANNIGPRQVASPATGGSNTVEESSSDVWTNHGTWSLGGPDSFGVGDERGSDLFTDPSKGSLTLTVNPTEPTCLLQFGVTQIYTEPFTASFTNGDTGAGFRVISQSYWNDLPSSDGAYNLCWER